MDLGRASAIAAGLCKNESLQKLDLTDMLLEAAFDGPTWQAMLQSNKHLMELDLCCNELYSNGPEDFETFARGLSGNKVLKKLYLDCYNIDNAGTTAMVSAFQGNETLEHLSLGVDGGALAIHGLWQSASLKLLDLSDNECEEDYTPTAFPEGLPNNATFEVLRISNCSLSTNDCLAVLDSLQENTVLRELEIQQKNFSLDVLCATALQVLLVKAPLQKLWLNGNGVTNEGMVVLVEAIKRNTSLIELSLDDFGIGNETLLDLGEALVENKTLESLSLVYNDFSAEVVCYFFGILPRIKGLKKLSLCVPDVESLGLALVSGLKMNTSMECIYGVILSRLPSDIQKSIQFYLKMNRNGRKFLQAPFCN